MAYKIHAWRETGALVGYDDEGFDRTSWLAIFAGMGHWPKRVSPWTGKEVPESMALQYLRQRREALAHITDGMPDHEIRSCATSSRAEDSARDDAHSPFA